LPDEIPEFKIFSGELAEISLVQLLVKTELAASNGEARRLIQQGGFSIDGNKIEDINAKAPSLPEFIVKAGKRKFVKIIIIP
jgi:tyrosyl-tRNA synthetase